MTIQAAAAPQPIKVFYSYAHEDEELRKGLQNHLKLLEHSKQITNWDDRMILPGADWDGAIRESLRNADLVLLLISAHFLASDYVMSTEIKLAMDRHAAGLAQVVPIRLRSVDLGPEDGEAMPFLKLNWLPTKDRPVMLWRDRDQAWTDVAKGIRALVKAIRATRPQMPTLSPARIPATGPDPLLQAVVNGYDAQIREASRARGVEPPPPAQVQKNALALIDTPEHRRILWVDDHPDNNTREIAALGKLQIEIQTVTSTSEALERVRTDKETFDLIISDWDRDGENREAGLRLVGELRAINYAPPVVFYHGETDPARRSGRTDAARAAGALGEAVYPHELMNLVTRALAG